MGEGGHWGEGGTDGGALAKVGGEGSEDAVLAQVDEGFEGGRTGRGRKWIRVSTGLERDGLDTMMGEGHLLEEAKKRTTKANCKVPGSIEKEWTT